MKRIILILATCLLVTTPVWGRKDGRKIIPVETDHSALVLAVTENGVLQTLHYGARVESPAQFALLETLRDDSYGDGPLAYPTVGGKYLGQSALHVKYADGRQNTELYYVSHALTRKGDVAVTSVTLKDPVTGLRILLEYEAYKKEDVISMHTEIYNDGDTPVRLKEYASGSLYVDSDKYLLTHFYGGWAREMQLESELLGHDVKVLESRRGTQVTQCNNPSFLLSLGTEALRETEGEVIAGALAWSGNFRLSFERDESERLRILGGISPYASAYPLAPGGVFITPDMLFTWTDHGAGGASRNLHRWARNYGVYGGGAVIPTLLNSWEGAYFNFTTGTLLGMIDDAASMGLEMFVLDDGWFGNTFPRNGDNAGLGDWEPNVSKIPEGIDYVASYAHAKGLKFGIWIEPEMVNPASQLAQAHPEWVVQSPGREIPQARNQWVLDLSNPAVQDFVFGIFDRTLQLSSRIDYIKWDCNRTVASFGSPYLGQEQERFFVDYCQGLYSVMQRIRKKYPEVLIQCCSSGGGRVDYGALKYFNEIWTSDNTDALTRAYIQYSTSLIYPACVMASHVSAVPNHQSGNVTPLKFRFDMACSGRLGMELQPKNLTADERALADRCIRSYKGYRDLMFGGDLYRLSSPYDSDYYALMYVSEDMRRAVVFVYCLKYQNRAIGARGFRLQGLDPALRYRITEQNVDRSAWWADGETLSGDFLMAGKVFNPYLPQTYSSAVFVLEAE